MSNFILDVTTVNQKEAKASLEEYITGLPDNEQWAQFYAGSSGQIVIDLIAGFKAYLAYDSISARRESYLQYSQVRSNQIGHAQNLGYNVYRGRNALLTVTFTPATSQVLPKWYLLGSVSGLSLVLLEETVVVSGTQISVSAVVGDITTETQQAESDTAAIFRFTESLVSEDIEFYIDDVLVDHSTDNLDLVEDMIFVQTNVLGSVDVKSLNSGDTLYSSGSELLLRWIQLNNLTFTVSDVSIDEADGVLDSVEITTVYQDPEDGDSIKLNAPLQNETKFTIRARNDYAKLLLLSDSDFIAAGGRDTDEAAVVEVFALKSDLSILSTAQKTTLSNSILSTRPLGVRPPTIVDAVPNFLELDITLVLETSVTGDPTDEVRNVLSEYEKLLSTPEEDQIVDFIEIEKEITGSDLIKISRVGISSTTREADKTYRKGQHVATPDINGFIYEASEFVRKSGSVEPVWGTPVTDTTGVITYGQEVSDNSVVWASIALDSAASIWVADTAYEVGDVVNHLSVSGNAPEASFEVIETTSKSGSVEPVWDTPASTEKVDERSFFDDNQLMWLMIDKEGAPDAWVANSTYVLGDSVAPTDVQSGQENVMFQVVSLVGKTSSETLVTSDFPSILGEEITDGEVKWKARLAASTPDSPEDNEYYLITETVSVS